MKLNFTKKILTVLFCLMSVMAILCFVGCKPTVEPGDPTGDGTGTGGGNVNPQNPPLVDKLFMFEEEMNPEYSSRTEALDTIFNPDELGELVLVFDRSEWNRHLEYCDKSGNQHEDSVHAKGFYFTKDNKEWFFNDIGFRIRGNTSRRRPQEGNGALNNDYVQAHFALDFEEWITDEQDEAGVEKKLADCMKGLILKRFKDDPTYSREVYSYNLFRKNGIWIAPRASYTTLKIQIVDDLDLDKDGDKTEFETVNYGVYGMIEEIKKQFLKERTKEEGGGEFSNNKGNLWKCLGANFKDTNSIGEEDVRFKKDENGNITNFVRETFAYDYKSDNFDSAKTQLLDFIKELNELPNCTDGIDDEADIETIKDFYTNKMDGDLFLKTYAINVILGMWDDYWINNNNYYFYFDKKTGKAYFIPYDYDNSLGVSHLGVDAGTHNPLKWGNLTDGNHPLIQKILQVPEYMDLYKNYLLEYSDANSHFDDDKSIAQITKWQEMIKPYINSPNLRYHDTTSTLEDKTNATWGDTYRDYKLTTPGKMNYFTVRQNAIKACVNPSKTFTLTLNAGDGYFETQDGDKSTLPYKFTEGTTLAEILNDFDGWKIQTDGNVEYSYIKDGVYYYPWCFIDSEGREIYESNISQITLYEDTTLNTLYKKWVPITFDGNGIMNKSVVRYLLEESDLTSMDFSETDEYLFIGWTLNHNGNDFVTKVPSEPVILYAKWRAKDDLLPFKISEDLSKVTFVFRPNDYNNYNGCLTDIQSVHLMAEFTDGGWKCHDVNKLTKDTDGNYSITLNTNDIYDKWPTFKFMINEKDWFGAGELKYNLPNEYSSGEYYDFNLVLPEPTITFDLNGGSTTTNLKDLYPTDGWFYWTVTDFFRLNVCYDNPTKDGFAFGGWTLEKDGDVFVDTIPFGKITVYAKWVEPTVLTLDNNGYPVQFIDKNSNFSSNLDLEFTPGQTIMDVLECNQVDWSTQYEQDGQRYQFSYLIDVNENRYDLETVLNESITLYLFFEVMPPLVTFDLNGGYIYLPVDDQDVRFDNSFSWETWDFTYGRKPQRDDGLVFRGWTLTRDGDEYVTTADHDITVYAKWGKLPNVTFNLNGGYIIDGSSKNYGPIEKSVDFDVTFDCVIPDPLKDKYSFIGWTSTQDGDDYIIKTEYDVTVYAKWRDSLELFSNGDIVGDFSANGTPLDYQGTGIYYYDFTYDENMNAWGSPYGEVQFKFRPVAEKWDVSYGPIEGDGNLIIGGEEIEFGIAYGSGTNLIISNLEPNDSYRIIVRCTSDSHYYVSVIKIN